MALNEVRPEVGARSSGLGAPVLDLPADLPGRARVHAELPRPAESIRCDVAEDHPLGRERASLGSGAGQREAPIDPVTDEVQEAALVIDPDLAPEPPLHIEDGPALSMQGLVRVPASELLVDHA